MARKEARTVPNLGGRHDRLFDSLNAVIAERATEGIPITHECWRNVVEAVHDLQTALGNPPRLCHVADQVIPLGVEGWIASFSKDRTFPLHHIGHPIRDWFLELLRFVNDRRLVTAEVRRTAARALIEALEHIHFDVPSLRTVWTKELQHVLKPEPAPELEAVPDPAPSAETDPPAVG